ncbi:MAG: YgjP-like metallopeptidase domain-containing protein [Myxococcota bacterium]
MQAFLEGGSGHLAVAGLEDVQRDLNARKQHDVVERKDGHAHPGQSSYLRAPMDRRTRRQLMERLTADAERIASHFGLEYQSLDAERANVKSRYGVCFDDRTIKIRLHHALTGEPLRYSSLVNTLCHEFAHLRHFNHGPRFKAFYLQLLEWSREQGIYVPRSASRSQNDPEPVAVAPQGPVQLDLFEGAG